MPCAQWLTMGGKAYSHWRCIIGSATLGGIPKKLNPSTILLLGRFQPRFQDEIDSSWFQEIPTDAQHVFAALFRTGCDWSYATSPETREISPAGSFLHPCTFWTLPSLPHAVALVQFCSVHLGFQQLNGVDCPAFGSHPICLRMSFFVTKDVQKWHGSSAE